jgi:hypothetical protein
MRRTLVVLAVLALPCLARAEDPDQLTGFITAIDSASAVKLDSTHVSLTAATQFCTRVREASGTVVEKCGGASSSTSPPFYIGEAIEVSGRFDHHTLAASKVTILTLSPASVSGTAIIDLIPSAQPANPQERLVRADGYLLRIARDTKLTLAPPLTSLADLSTNQWIRYSGVQQTDGTVTVHSASITPNKVSSTEDKLRKRTEYEPSKVADDAHQSGISKAFIGTDYKRVPPWHDEAMQARVDRIGQSLIPAYQRALPDGDPAKINFRFQLIDAKKSRDAVYLSSGVIVIAHQVVERMQNDDQLATVLADNIAENIEKDTLHMVSVGRKVLVADIAGDVAGAFVPGLGLATDLAGGGAAQHIYDLQLQQSGRVSLCLLHDAGYNLDEAPLAWWLLAAKPNRQLDQTKLPPRAATLYTMLATTWHTAVVSGAAGATQDAAALATASKAADVPATPTSKN